MGSSAFRQTVFLAGSVVILAGCTTVGPDYVPPDLSGQHHANWKNEPATGSRTSLSPSPPTAEWWRQFDDPELGRLVTRLAEGNLDLAEARERIVEARARRGFVHADKLPRVDLSGQVLSAGTGDEALTFQGPPPGEEADLFAAGALAGWELDLWGRISRLTESAEREIEAEFEAYRHAAVSLTAELALAYIDTRALEARLSILDRNIALLQNSLELVESRLRAGTGTELDVKQARRLLRRTRADRPTLVQARAVAYHRIATLLGQAPGHSVIGAGTLPKPPVMVGIGLPAELITRRADVRRAERQYAAAVANIGAAMAERYPRLTLAGSLNFQTDDAGGVFKTDALTYSLGPSLSFPLFDGGRIESNIRVRASQAEQARLNLQKTLLTAVKEVEDAAAGVIQHQKRVARLGGAADDARRSVVLAEQLYRSGLGNLLQFIDAQRELLAIEDTLLISRQNELGGIVRLYRALGGGWTALPLVQTASGSSEEGGTK